MASNVPAGAEPARPSRPPGPTYTPEAYTLQGPLSNRPVGSEAAARRPQAAPVLLAEVGGLPYQFTGFHSFIYSFVLFPPGSRLPVAMILGRGHQVSKRGDARDLFLSGKGKALPPSLIEGDGGSESQLPLPCRRDGRSGGHQH